MEECLQNGGVLSVFFEKESCEIKLKDTSLDSKSVFSLWLKVLFKFEFGDG